MTKPRLNNQPYHHLLEALNAALPLEYAIRTGQELFPQEFNRLNEISGQMREAWIGKGYSEEVIRQDGLVDGCWDLLQLGYVEDRVPNRYWLPGDLARQLRIRESLLKTFGPLIGPIRLPFADCYRVCDLLNGNDIAGLIKEVYRKKDGIDKMFFENEVPLSKFVLSIRTPIPRYFGSVQQVHLISTDSSILTHIGIMLNPDMNLDDIDGALHEFLYHYAMFRKASKSLHEPDPVVNELLMRWGLPSKPPVGAEVTQLNEIHSALHGLHCWDRRRFHSKEKPRGSVSCAIKDVLALYPWDGQPTTEAVSAHYQKVKKRIDHLRANELARQNRLRQATAV